MSWNNGRIDDAAFFTVPVFYKIFNQTQTMSEDLLITGYDTAQHNFPPLRIKWMTFQAIVNFVKSFTFVWIYQETFQ